MCVSAHYLRCCITLFSSRYLARSLVDLIHRKHCEGEEDRRVVCVFNGLCSGSWNHGTDCSTACGAGVQFNSF